MASEASADPGNDDLYPSIDQATNAAIARTSSMQPYYFSGVSYNYCAHLGAFWFEQMQHVQTIPPKYDFKSKVFPLARIKKIMRMNKEVKMISSETPILFSKACELFIGDLTIRSWGQTWENKRKTVNRCDVMAAMGRSEVYDFLLDLLPRDVEDAELFSSSSSATPSPPHPSPRVHSPHMSTLPPIDPLVPYIAPPSDIPVDQKYSS